MSLVASNCPRIRASVNSEPSRGVLPALRDTVPRGGGSPAISSIPPGRSRRGESKRAASVGRSRIEATREGSLHQGTDFGQGIGPAGSPGAMGAGGLSPAAGRGSGTALGADSGAGAGAGTGAGAEADELGAVEEASGGAWAGADGSTTMGGPVWTTVPPAGPPRNPQFGPVQGAGKSSQVSQCVHPVMPTASVTAASRRLVRDIPVSFPFRDMVGRSERPRPSSVRGESAGAVACAELMVLTIIGPDRRLR